MSELYAIVPRKLTVMMSRKGVSARERAVLDALMHHGISDDGEIGVARNGYAMSAADVSEYLDGEVSPDAVRHVMASLRNRGFLVPSRKRKVGKGYVTIHRLSDEVLEHLREGTCITETNDDAAHTNVLSDTPTHVLGDMGDMSGTTYTPLDTHKEQEGIKTCNFISDGTLRNADGEKERNTSHEQTSETDRDGSCDAGEPMLYYPYPTDVDEVMDYLESVQDIPGYDAALFMTEYPETVERFFYGNVSRGWVLRDGKPTLDWHYAVMSYAVKVARATCPGVEFSVPRERLLAERRASGQGGRW